MDVAIDQEKEIITDDIFSRIEQINLVDRYAAYQVFSKYWDIISADIEMLQNEGFEVITQVDPNIVIKKSNKSDADSEIIEVQEGWKGHILPFELVQNILMPDDVKKINLLEERLTEISYEYEEIIDSLEDDEKEGKYLNDNNDAFVSKELKLACNEILRDLSNVEIDSLNKYLMLSKKEALTFMMSCSDVDWEKIEKNKDGTCKKPSVISRLQQLKLEFEFPEDSLDGKLIRALKLMNEESALKSKLKKMQDELHIKTKETIENLSEEKALQIVEKKWIAPLVHDLTDIPSSVISDMKQKIDYLVSKYLTTMHDIQQEKNNVRCNIAGMISNLNAIGPDMKGLQEFKLILGGENE